MPQPLRVLVGALGPGLLPSARAGVPDGTVLLDLGPEHPSRAGLLELRLWVEDHLVKEADVLIGALHRGAEKLYEVRDYRQILMLADRHDWQGPYAAELAVALACEELLGLSVPSRATWLRTVLVEHTRVASHLAFLGWLLRDLGLPAPTGLREELRAHLLALTGNRVHPMVTVIGGLALDATPEWVAAEAALLTEVAAAAAGWRSTLATDPRAGRLHGLAPITPAVVLAYGISGPAARSAGVDLDLRRRQPPLSYGELSEVLGGPGGPTTGDAYARFATLLAELDQSARLVRACAARLATVTGPVNVPLPKILKLPEGEVAARVEAPLGWAGCWLVSRGEKTPWRLKLRTPSFQHVSALPAVLPGVGVSDLEPALASIGYVVGDVDK